MSLVVLFLPIVLIPWLLPWIFDTEKSKFPVHYSFYNDLHRWITIANQLILLLLIFYSFYLEVETSLVFFSLGIILYALFLPLLLWAHLSLLKKKKGELLQKGLYRFSRNPIYVSTSILFLSLALISGSIFFFYGVVVFIFSQHFVIFWEEKQMQSDYAQDYTEYQKKTARYFIWF